MDNITKEQYKTLVTSLLDLILGDISIKTVKQKKENGENHNYHSIFDGDGEDVMNIWIKGPKSKGCKRDLTLESELTKKMEGYIPFYKHKRFSEVLVDYVYNHTGIKCDCVQYDYEFQNVVDDSDDEEYEYTTSKTRRYNIKKKKNIKESLTERSNLENIIYDFLQDDFYPDYNWGPELFDFYREDVEKYGSIPFYINDSEGYVYYDDGTLEIMPWVCKKLNEYFNDSWYSVFKYWFEEHSGLKVERIVDSTDNNVLLGESTDKNKKLINDVIGFDFSNRITQITSSYDVPMEFDVCFNYQSVRQWLNVWGPIYLFSLNGSKILYQDRWDYEWFVYDDCSEYDNNEIPEKLGIAILGLRFSDIIDMYFQEEE
jgi:hypothetical protein